MIVNVACQRLKRSSSVVSQKKWWRRFQKKTWLTGKTATYLVFVINSGSLIQDFDTAKPKVNVFNPDFERDGWQTSHTVITLHCANTPFILDSVRNQLNNRNLTIYTVFNMPLSISRNETGRLLDVQTSKEPFVHAVAEKCQ